MRKVIFLDIDGVLNGYTKNLINDTFDPDKLASMISLARDTGSEIVITSSRRCYREERDMIERTFKDFHFDVSFLSDHRTYPDRADEIVEYLHKNVGIMRFVVIDDCDYKYTKNPLLKNRFVQPTLGGFTEKDYKEAYDLLK